MGYRSIYPPSIPSRDLTRNIQLNESPSLAQIDEWMMELGCQKIVAGKTFQERDITLYWKDVSLFLKNSGMKAGRVNNKNVLFLSLVHGNEPMGLISLLMGAKELDAASTNNSMDFPTIRVYFIPVVDVDGYEANLARGEDERGCHRPNLRPTCDKYSKVAGRISPGMSNMTTIPIDSCISGGLTGNGGVDLNRNFPFDWEANNQSVCSYNYHGPHPLSEPETQTIAKVVQEYNITAAVVLKF